MISELDLFFKASREISRCNVTKQKAPADGVEADGAENNNAEDGGDNGVMPTKAKKRCMVDLVKRRQAVSHPFNLEKLLRTSFQPAEITRLKDRFQALSSRTPLREQILKNVTVPGAMDQYASGFDWLSQREEAVFGGMFDWNGLLQLISNEVHITGNCAACEKPVELQSPTVVPRLLEQVRGLSHDGPLAGSGFGKCLRWASG